MNLYPNEDIGSPVMELNDFGDIGEQFLQTGIVVGPSGDWDCGPKAELYREITEMIIWVENCEDPTLPQFLQDVLR